MDRDALRALQAPLKERYKADPAAARVTLAASATLGEGVSCSVRTGRAIAEAGLHPATGGDGSMLCSGDMLLEALAACAGVTLRAVALSIGIPVASGRVQVEGDLDFRGTLGVGREAPVGFSAVRVRFELETTADDEELATLLRLTERYCVVYQSLAQGLPVTATIASDRADVLRRFGLGADDLATWQESRGASFEDWLTDRVARRPAGDRARAVYGADDVHDFARGALLATLELRAGDRLLDLGCGGGLLLRDALAAGATVTGLDHSEEMVRLARRRAPGAEVVLGSAEQLPFASAAFTAIAMSVVFLFLPDPLAVLRECRRVLAPGGRLALYTTSPALRGTPAAPEPLASRCHFYEDHALAELALRAGFADIAVSDDDGGQLLSAR
jgi:SAM-dependent methyltransferase/uncharacterized OsmC-like protein